MTVTEELKIKTKAAATPEQQLELAREALEYALKRVETDPDFRWHMYGTETASKILVAYCAITGKPLETFTNRHEARMKNSTGEFETPRHKKLDDLRDEILDFSVDSLDLKEAHAVLEKLQRQAEQI